MTVSLRIFPKKRQLPMKKPKSFVLFPFEMHEKMRETFEEKESESLELIKNHLKHFKKCFVASSHGKDSLVMVHLIWRACQELKIPMVDVWLNHTLNVYKEEKEFWKKFNTWLGIEDNFKIFYPPKDKKGNRYTVWSIAKSAGHLPNFRSTAKAKLSYKKTNTPECCDILKKKSINEYLKNLPKDERYDCSFIGTRAEESQMRSLGVLQRCRSYLIKTRKPYPIQAVTPLSFWKKADIYEYFARYKLPINPTYAVHNLERMGCASCPAHKNWEIRLASDPTSEGFGMLNQNLKILKSTEPERLEKSINTLKDFLKSKDSKILTEAMRLRLINTIQSFDSNFTTLGDFT